MLRAYDDQLRTDAEASGAEGVTRLGPLWLVSHPGDVVQITYRDLGGASATEVRELVRRAVTACRGLGVTAIEWKARGHDVAPGLHDALVASGFVAGEVESVMVGEAHALSVSVDIPKGVPGTAFAGLWGGATRPAWRSRGVYRALTAHRAHSAAVGQAVAA